jgi:hypothetical protein
LDRVFFHSRRRIDRAELSPPYLVVRRRGRQHFDLVVHRRNAFNRLHRFPRRISASDLLLRAASHGLRSPGMPGYRTSYRTAAPPARAALPFPAAPATLLPVARPAIAARLRKEGPNRRAEQVCSTTQKIRVCERRKATLSFIRLSSFRSTASRTSRILHNRRIPGDLSWFCIGISR